MALSIDNRAIDNRAGDNRARLFFALCPDEAVRQRLAELQAKFDAGAARPVPPANFHLTLAFLGTLARPEIDCYAHAAEAVVVRPGSLELNCCGHFGRRSVCWFGATDVPAALQALCGGLRQSIASCGYEDWREFKPHITLFRKAADVKLPAEVPTIKLYVDRFFLMQSLSAGQGVRYVVVREYR